MSLHPCPSCRRHVRREATCPFCGASLSQLPERAEPMRGARRAALLAVSAALASTTFVACGDDTGTGNAGGGGQNAGGQNTGGQNNGGDNNGGTNQGGDPASGGGGTTSDGGAGGAPDGGGGAGTGGDGTGGDPDTGGFGGNIAPPYGAPPI
ncbi:MAG: hypothetical protein HOW73_12405, partial [Polyangiaceae bacterium]|nr:hypothetical protein [Polyangiaceae bacterium]